MEERNLKVLKMDYIKAESLVLDIEGAERATINTRKVFDEIVVHDVMRMVRMLILAGASLAFLAIVLGLMGLTYPIWGNTGETGNWSDGPSFFAAVAFMIGMFYYIILVVQKDRHTTIAGDKAKGTIEAQEHFKDRESKSKKTLKIEDVIQIECQKQRVTDSDGPNYDETGIYARSKNDQLTKLTWFKEVAPLDDIITHFNAWLRGEEVDPAVYSLSL